MQTGHIVLSTEHDRLVLVSIETGEALVTLRADATMWPGDKVRDGDRVEFDAEGDHLVGIRPFADHPVATLYATQRHPRWDKGETWAQVRSQRP